MKKLLLLFTCLSLFAATAAAQYYTEMGSQAVINYSSKEYDAFRQNWAITQDERGIMYFGNNFGLLEFDGSKWRLYEVPNQSDVFSLAIGNDSKIYAGANGDLGYFVPDSSGKLTFHSLINFLPKDKRDFSGVYQTYVSSGKVYFNSFNYIFIWNIKKREFKIIQPENSFHVMFKVNGTIYVREWGKGLEVLKNDSFSLVKGGEKFADERIYVMLPFPGEDGTILIVTRTMGLFKYDGVNFIPFKTEADKFIKKNLIFFPGTVLSDGNILLATLNGGAVVIDTTGREVRSYNLKNGIINNHINFTFQDRSGAIWLATDNGISRIDYSSPASYFDSRNNFSTSPSDIIRYNGIIYTATDNGVYSLDPNTSMFHRLRNSNSQSGSFVKMGNELLIGTDDGLFKVEKDKLTPIRKTIGNEYNINVLKRSGLNPNRIYVGTFNGLWSVLKSGNKWIDEGQILDVTDLPTSIVEDKDGSVWMGTQSSGLFKVTFQKDEEGNIILKKPIIEHFDKTNGLQDGTMEVGKINGVNYFSGVDSLYIFDENKKLFYVDTANKIISKFYKTYPKTNTTHFWGKDNLGRLFVGTKEKMEMGTLQPNDSWKWVPSPLGRFMEEFVEIYSEKNGVVWLCTPNTIIKYDFRKKNLGSTKYSALVRRVEIGEDSTIYFGGKVGKTVIPEITFKNNSIKFRYSATSYEGKNTNKFKTFLDGFDKGWSTYSTETTKEYTNLPPGKYTFKVAALNILGNESSTGTYSFEILPPWYRTWWAYVVYIILLGLLVFAVDRIQRKRLLAKERQRAEFREAKLRAQAVESENKVLQAENERKLKDLEHAKEIEKAYTELKATQAQLIHSEKMASLGELTSGIAHEIQNPLNFVNNFSEISGELLDDINEELKNNNKEEVLAILEDLKQNLEKINHHGKRADSIVKGMLLHSRGTSGEKTLTDINALLEQYVNLAYHGMRAKDKELNITIEKDYDKSIKKINVVPQDISRVFLNIINNAYYAANEEKKKNGDDFQPTLKISTKNLNNKVEIRIADNGTGIPEKIKDKIFQPFFTTKPTGEGTGLGLSLSYDIITKVHGGELKVKTKEGEGTEFVISLHYV